MKNSLLLIIFILYTLVIFNLSNHYLLLLLFLIHILIGVLLKIKMIKLIHNILKLLPYILFIIIMNLLFSNISNSILIGERLIIVCNLTFIINYILNPLKLSKAISNILWPLKLFKIDVEQISLIITIAISFIPILIEESISIKHSLISKNFKFNLKNVFKQPHIFVLTFIKNIFERIEEMEKTFKAKAYN